MVRRVDAAEEKAQQCRYRVEFIGEFHTHHDAKGLRRLAAKEQKRVEWWVAEAERLRERLRVLLAGEDAV